MAGNFDVVVIAGPTASGKTGAGIGLAAALNGEIVSADARQIYRYMDVGTAKATAEEQKKAVHHLIDIVDPDAHYSAGRWAEDSHRVISDMIARGKVPILVGGAGLYLKALFDGFAPIPEIPEGIRTSLEAVATQDVSRLFSRLLEVDPAWAEKIQPADKQRIVRGLEVYETTGKTLTQFQNLPREPAGGHWRTRWFALGWPRDVLYERINGRALEMVQQGLVKEVEGLLERGYTAGMNALKTFGYREILDHLSGTLSLEEAISDLQKGSRNYAKRQLTWFRGEARMTWIQAGERDAAAEILTQLEA